MENSLEYCNSFSVRHNKVHFVFSVAQLQYIEHALLFYDSERGSTPAAASLIQAISDAARSVVEGVVEGFDHG